jgi:hypothetical protein
MVAILAILIEVMDKELSAPLIAAVSAAVGVAGYFLCRYKRYLALVIIPMLLFGTYIILSEVEDPYIRPAILSEAGSSYFVITYISIGFAFLATAAGVVSSRKRKA